MSATARSYSAIGGYSYGTLLTIDEGGDWRDGRAEHLGEKREQGLRNLQFFTDSSKAEILFQVFDET